MPRMRHRAQDVGKENTIRYPEVEISRDRKIRVFGFFFGIARKTPEGWQGVWGDPIAPSAEITDHRRLDDLRAEALRRFNETQ